eukprot:11958615-Ditylum_brightwellii.AAC.1
MHKFFPFYIINEFVVSSNKYIHARKQAEPHLKVCQTKRATDLTHAEMYYSTIIIYYMSICKLLHKRDYWSAHRLMPTHKTIELTGMPCNRFGFIWRHFHVQTYAINYQDDMSDIEDESDEDEDLIEETLERVQADKDTMDEDYLSMERSSSDTSTNNQQFGIGVGMDKDKEHWQKKHVWYYKIKDFINHMREINIDLINVLGTCLSLDEMMIRFSGRSSETHWIKNKPIGEGYTFFALTALQ